MQYILMTGLQYYNIFYCLFLMFLASDNVLQRYTLEAVDSLLVSGYTQQTLLNSAQRPGNKPEPWISGVLCALNFICMFRCGLKCVCLLQF